ncbi:MAG: cytochrome P460 family protein [Phototrophicaceae bacterium]
MQARLLIFVGVFCAVMGGLIWLNQTTPIGSASGYMPNVSLPPNYRDVLVHYATVDRPDNRTRNVYITAGAPAIIASNSTARLPFGTMVVIEAHRGTAQNPSSGHADNVHVMVKRADWQAGDYQDMERAGEWNFFSFDPRTGALANEDITPCFDCHGNNSQIDFIFTRGLIAEYGQTGEPQLAYCNRTDRLPCTFE